jgi:CPA1 family monovalent cation:H+ antiporter
MIDTFLLCFALVAVTAVCAVAARRLSVPSSIVLVITGIALAFVPGLPNVQLDPQVVMLLFLPPLLYMAGVSMSWRGFRDNLRPIALLAVGCVLFTACTVAAVAHWAIGFPWGVAFVLGAVVSPPDVLAPMAIARRLQVPKRILTILEGEGLVNDATALILFRFAVAAVGTGAFSVGHAAGAFILIVIGETLYGVLVGWAMLRLRRGMRDQMVEMTLSLLTPYAAFWPPEMIGGSGVLAAVSAGLYVSWNGPRLISASTRLHGFFFWGLVVYLAEALLFLLTGLQARTILEGLGDIPWPRLVLHGAIICLVVIVTRFLWVYPVSYLPRWLARTIGFGRPAVPWRAPFVIAFMGIRGVVSLAAALSIPLTVASGQPFPERNMVLFLTLCVILATLLGQGSLLPLVIRQLGLAEHGRRERAKDEQRTLRARIDAVRAALARLETLIDRGKLPADLAGALRSRHEDRLRRLERHGESDGADDMVKRSGDWERQLIDAERERTQQLHHAGAVSDEARRQIERELDLEEARVVQAGRDPA